MNTRQPTERIVGFIHFLRDEGFSIGIQDVKDILAGLDTESFTDRTCSRNIIRSLTCHCQNDWQKFDDLFLDYWLAPKEEIVTVRPGNDTQRGLSRTDLTGIGGSTQEIPEQMGGITGLKGSGAGKQRTISKADFRFLNDHKAMQEIERLAEQLAAKLKQRLRRRQVIQTYGSKIAMRQTIRRNLSYGGMPVHTFYKNRRREPLHLVILHDVSHSMAWNNPLLFRFVRGIIRTFKNSEAFAFHTRLFRVTEFYREPSLQIMKQRLEARNHLWMGGTCIAESIDKFNHCYAAKTLMSKSVLMIISDGFDTNEPDYLAHVLGKTRKYVKNIIWLNPMLGREGYDPDKKSMRAAMPFINRHASAHSLESLKETVNYLAG